MKRVNGEALVNKDVGIRVDQNFKTGAQTHRLMVRDQAGVKYFIPLKAAVAAIQEFMWKAEELPEGVELTAPVHFEKMPR